MMSASAIQHLQDEATEMAAQESMSPMPLWDENTVMDDVRRSPSVGEYVHPEWQPASYQDFENCLEDASYACYDQDPGIWVFCDSSGFGSPGEPALTFRQLVKMLERCVVRAGEMGLTLGTTIVEEGQFQIHLGLFVK